MSSRPPNLAKGSNPWPTLSKDLDELLRVCTVRLRVGQGSDQGTGFFVAPGLILTCAHVVEAAQPNTKPVQVDWNGQSHTAKIQTCLAKPYPDLALLCLDLQHHPRPLSIWNPLDYLVLLYWVFYFPQALRWYVETFGSLPAKTNGWQAIRQDSIQLRLALQGLVLTLVIPFSFATLMR